MSKPGADQDLPADQFNTLIGLMNQGRFGEMAAYAGGLVRQYPRSFRLWNMLGVASAQSNDVETAINAFRKASLIDPRSHQAHGNLGSMLQMQGKLDDAARSLRRAIALNPDAPELHYNLGRLHYERGLYDEAVGANARAVALEPAYVMAHNNMGNALRKLGELDRAVAAYRRVLELAPDFAEGHNNLATALLDQEKFDEAALACRQALAINPNYAEGHNNMGVVLCEKGALAEAAASYARALMMRPDYAEAFNNLAFVLGEQGIYEDAIVCSNRALEIDPEFAEAHNQLGNVYRIQGKLVQSLAHFAEAIRIKPDYIMALGNYANALSDVVRFDEASARYQQALQLADAAPEYASVHSNYLFFQNFLPDLAQSDALAEAQRYGAKISGLAQPKYTHWSSNPAPARLRIGFVSGDLINHPVGFFSESLFAQLDPAAFELIAFATRPKIDDLTRRIQPRFSEWVPIYGMSNATAAAAIHRLGIHILIDLAGHSGFNRLPVFAHKPAPVQASWLGYFATTGLPEMDYFIGDPHVLPAGSGDAFTERPWPLPETWFCMATPTEIPVAPLPAVSNGHVTFGCFGKLCKVNAEVVETWARVLHAIPDAHMVIKASQFGEEEIAAQILDQFAARGITPDRLTLERSSPRDEYMASYNRIDIVLDTFPYPGGTTSVEAMWMGVPVLTLAGDRFLGRLGVSIAHNAGHPHWIASDRDDYVAKAIALSSDLPALAATRAAMRPRLRQSPLFDAPRFASHFGDMLRRMWQAHVQTLAPAS